MDKNRDRGAASRRDGRRRRALPWPAWAHGAVGVRPGASPATADRAAAAGMRDVGTAGEMAGQADVILSVCPPHAALEVARSAGRASVASTSTRTRCRRPTAREVAQMVTAGGATLRGRRDHRRPAALPRGQPPVSVRPAGRGDQQAVRRHAPRCPGDRGRNRPASAVKMAYAAWTKGTAALHPRHPCPGPRRGRRGNALAEWQLSQPALTARSHAAARSATAEGLALGRRNGGDRRHHVRRRPPPGFHEAAAAIYDRVPHAAAPAPTSEPSLHSDHALRPSVSHLTRSAGPRARADAVSRRSGGPTSAGPAAGVSSRQA